MQSMRKTTGENCANRGRFRPRMSFQPRISRNEGILDAADGCRWRRTTTSCYSASLWAEPGRSVWDATAFTKNPDRLPEAR
jgi:hypothetical protein